MALRLGVDVGGTFTDILLVNEITSETHMAKVLSTPSDPSIGVINGINKVCNASAINSDDITHVMHGTTVATNTILTATGARVGLITTKGFRQVLHIARSYVPGGLGGWVIYVKSEPLAPLELTVEADERVSAKGEIVKPLDETSIRASLNDLKTQGIEALTVSLINSFANATHEQRIREIAQEILPDIPVSISSEVIPEMQEYERTVTTVANSYVHPKVEHYIGNLKNELTNLSKGVQLHILRSDGGLASSEAAEKYPVNMLMSGPAGGVSGAIWVAQQAGYPNLLTLDMGGTSTDVCLVQESRAQLRRETTVGDVSVRASSVDVRTVGAGGGSIAHVPALTKALRVGPQSAGADPGPAAYNKGGIQPTVTDANVVLGYLPSVAKLGGDMAIDKTLAEQAVQSIADALDLSLKQAAAGIIDIVNENMCGALRLVSVEKGYDPRDFALIAFGGAGPLHANAVGKLMGSWPVIIPPGPGVLCAYGDATTRIRDESSRTFIRRFSEIETDEIIDILTALAEDAAKTLDAENIPRSEQETSCQIDIRYHGQTLLLTVDIAIDDLRAASLDLLGDKFAEMHEQLFNFKLSEEKEIVNLRAVVESQATMVKIKHIESGDEDPSAALYSTDTVFMDGEDRQANIYIREKLLAGNKIKGPAIITEMDSTTVILNDYVGEVDGNGNILIEPL